MLISKVTQDTSNLLHVNSKLNIVETGGKYLGLNYCNCSFVIFTISEKCYAADDSNTAPGSLIINSLILDSTLKAFWGVGGLVNLSKYLI